MTIKKQQSRSINRKLLFLVVIGIGVLVSISINLSQMKGTTSSEVKRERLQVQGKSYEFLLKNHQLYLENEVTGEESLFLEEKLLDIKGYDLNLDDEEELLVLTLNESPSPVNNRSFGKELQLYKLSVDQNSLKPTLMYTNDISSVCPFMLEAGKLETKEAYATLFVGVYKNTKYYSEVINRPFFFSWNGEFIERKWTGSYLSHNELMDLIFVDLTEDGSDEIAVLEKTKDGTYQVSLYKWLNFGFDYLTTSKKKYTKLGDLKLEKEREKTKIKIVFKDGKEEEVDF